jgi:hypothetical protein
VVGVIEDKKGQPLKVGLRISVKEGQRFAA